MATIKVVDISLQESLEGKTVRHIFNQPANFSKMVENKIYIKAAIIYGLDRKSLYMVKQTIEQRD